MSVPVPLEKLRAEVDRLGSLAYFLTTSSDARPHCVAVVVGWEGAQLQVAPGNTTVKNAAERPLVSLLWPPPAPGEYSLIVDGEATASSSSGEGRNSVRITPTKAVFHRPADDGGHDCIPVYSGTDSPTPAP